MFARHGAKTPRNTLASWIGYIDPLIEALRQHLLTALPAPYRRDDAPGQPRTRSSGQCFFLHVGPARGAAGQQVVLFDYATSRAGWPPVDL
ncbi:hypothetical protein [Vreelandella neptunia]|uniref:hypothetical protein n=1 Tax=Vreelandella neptunia TaxID=115551 RepID=UPI003CCA59A0